MHSPASGFEFLLPFNNLHRFPLHILASLFSSKPSKSTIKSLPNHTRKPSLISPAHTTTQLLVQTTKPISISISSQPQGDSASISKTVITSQLTTLEARLQLLKVKLIDDLKRDPPAAQQQKPAWTESHSYVRGVRTNNNYLLLSVTESNMVRAKKITKPLRSRRAYLAKREDDFIWGSSSPLRNSLKYCNETELL